MIISHTYGNQSRINEGQAGDPTSRQAAEAGLDRPAL
jgi:hypothetical protein